LRVPPPAGDAGDGDRDCARLRFKAPDAISRAVSSLTAPWRASVAARTPSISRFASFE